MTQPIVETRSVGAIRTGVLSLYRGREGATMIDSERLSRVFVELADTLVDDFDVVALMDMLANRSVELLDVSDAGVILADPQGMLRSVASSNEMARLLDLFELQNDEGPCLDCYRTGAQIINQPLDPGDERWPRFGPEARRLGFVMVHALPMRLRGHVIGAVNLFATAQSPLSPGEVEIGQALADVATVGLLQQRSIHDARVLNEQLQVALTSRVVIEQAKGMIAQQLHLEMDAAFDRLRRYARHHNRKLVEVARAVLDRTLDTSVLDQA